MKYFTSEELKCHCGCGLCEMNGEFLNKLDRLRESLGFAFPITSGYRCPEYNAKVSKVEKSAHVLGRAVDIGLFGRKAYDIVSSAKTFGFTGIGIARTFVHLDDTEGPKRPMIWIY